MSYKIKNVSYAALADGFMFRTVEGAHAQAQFPLTLIPIRIDLDVPIHQQDTPYPIPPRAMESGINLALPPFRRPELSPGYKIRDIFMWNLHEALYTPEDFAQAFVQDLDIPGASGLMFQISHQIRTQLEDYAGVALHPLFHTSSKSGANAAVKSNGNETVQPTLTNGHSRDGTPRPSQGVSTPRLASVTPAAGTPAPSTPQVHTLTNGATVTAIATPMPVDVVADPTDGMDVDQSLNPDDMYRCIVKLSIYLSSRLYEDKFEWSLLHPPGAAEAFAKQTCADMGLNGEWALAITHAIYEAVLKLKKETCEGGMMIGSGLWGTGEVDNQAVRAQEGAGWRYDDADFGAEWEPKLEALSKEEIEKREGDRERQLRRLRRETAKFSSTSGMAPSAREQEAQARGSYFDTPGGGAGDETPLLGRGERSRKKRRLRSPSPTGKAGTPGEDKPNDSGWGGVGSKLEEYERMNWKCRHCQVHGGAVWAVRDGPAGPRVCCFLSSSSSFTFHFEECSLG